MAISFDNWRVFFHDSVTPDDARAFSQACKSKLADDIEPIPFALTNNTFDLNTIRPSYPACGEEGYCLAVANIQSDSARTINFGISTEWWLEVYLNGQLVGTTREAGNGTPDFTPLAHIYALPLVAGDNTLAVWLHHSPWYNHWPLSAIILPEPPAIVDPLMPISRLRQLFWPTHERIVAGPFLKAADGRLQIQVELFQPYAAILQLRRQGEDEWTELRNYVLGQLPTYSQHVFDLPELSPGTVYEYRLMTADTSLFDEEFTPVYSFRTPEAESPVHTMFCTADLQMPPQERQVIIRQFLEGDLPKADLFCTLGDMLNTSENIFNDYFLDIIAPSLKASNHRQIYLPVRGNHELRGNRSTDWPLLFGCSYYLFRYADTAYIVLDSGEDKDHKKPPHVYVRRTDYQVLFQAEREWLLQAVQTPDFLTARHRIILCHATPFDQDADFEEFHVQFIARNLQRLLGDLFYGPNPRFKIDLWLAGHTHRSARYTPHDQKIVSFSPPGAHYLTEREKGLYPFPVVVLDGPGSVGPCLAAGTTLTVAPDYLEVVTRQDNGTLIDHIRIRDDLSVEVIETALQ
jgi:hypothetical protein